mgnify:CR=1 FL=1
MKVLVLTSNIPATSRMPGSPRLFSLTRELSGHHEIVLAAFSPSEDRYRQFMSDPENLKVYKKIEILPSPPRHTWWGQQWHRAHLAAHFETRYRCPAYYRALRERIKALCVQEHVEMIYVDLLDMAQYVDPETHIPAIVDITDSMTLLGSRMLRAERNLRKKLSVYLMFMRARSLEQSLGKQFRLIITNSEVDEAAIKGLSPSANTLTVTNGIDTRFFSAEEGVSESGKIVFTGVMGYPPNEDAAIYFSQEIFPLIRAEHPSAQFWIVGSGPSQRVKDLACSPGVHVTGEVEDIRPYVRSAAVVVCPLRLGSGVKNKILVAMAMQKPVVATSLSIEGLDLFDNKEVLLADSPSMFAEKVLYVMANNDEASRLGRNGLKRVQEHHSWAAMGMALETAMQSALAEANGSPR